MQTSTLALLGGGAVAVAVGAAVYLRPLPQDTPVGLTPSEVTIAEEAAVEEAAVEEAGAIVAEEAATEEIVADGVVGDPDVVTPEPAAEPETDQPEAVGPETGQLEADVPDTAELDATEPEIIEPEVAPTPETPAPSAPVLTEFRFEPDGAVLVSGQADSGATVAILIDGAEIDRLEAGFDGAFFYVGFLGFSDAPRVLSVVSDPEGTGLSADRTFVMDANPEPVVVARVQPTEDDSPTDTPIVQDDTQRDVTAEADAETGVPVNLDQEADIVLAEPVTTETAPADPVSPTILSVTQDGVDVVRAPVADTSPEVMSTVALDAITYDPEGEVVLQGRALGEGYVQVYVDNAPISRLPVDADGTWRGDLPDVDKGVYTLRIDEVDSDGDVVSRIETPFLREDPETVAAALAEEVDDPAFSVATRTVQPGATLWAIAEERYGEGVLYVTVFEANRDRIRDPDLIYPGQVFVLPEDEE